MKSQQQSALTQSLFSWFSLHHSRKKDWTFLPLLSKCSHVCTDFLFSPHLFNFPVNLLHFTSKLFSIHHRAYLFSPPSKLSLYNPRYFSLFFPLSAYKPALLIYLSSVSSISSSHTCPSSWSGRSLSLRALLLRLCLVLLPVKLLLYSTPCW